MPTPPRLRFGAYWLDPASAQVGQGAQLVRLTPKAFALLRYLVERPGQLVTKDELLAAVWAGTVVSEAALTKCVRELRQALHDDAQAPRYIETAHRRGVRFLAPVTPATQPVRRRVSRGRRPPPATPHLLPPTPSLVGREAELAHLHSWGEQALHGARQMLFVTGEAGIGKTTLVDAVVHRLVQEQRVWVARGQCIEHYGGGEAYMPVLEALEQLGRGPAGARLVSVLRQHAPTWLVQLPGLLRESERERLQRQVQGADQARMLRELATALDVLTTRQGLVLWLEDLQWSDVSTLDVLAVLGRRQAPARLLVLGTYRPVEVLVRDHPLKRVKQELQGHGQCQELALEFLRAAAVGAYLARRFPGLEQDAAGLHRLAQWMHQRTDGNALFMVTMGDYFVQQGVLREVAGQWALPRPLEDVAGGVPESLRQMIEHHFAYLQPAEQRLLEVASVEGIEFTTAAVAAGLATPADTVEEGCEGLARRQHFVQARGTEVWPDGTVVGRYGFLHGLYHEVLYRRVPAGRRVRLHQAIGARKEAGYGEGAGEIAAALALHFARGRDYGRAVRYSRQAGAKALAGSACREAVGYFEQALETLAHLPPDRATLEQAIDLRFDLRNVLHPLGEFMRILDHLRQAEPLAEALGDHRRLGQIADFMASCLLHLNAHDDAVAAAQRALAMATTLGDVGLQVRANIRLGEVYWGLSDYRRAAEVYRRNVETLQGVLLQERLGAAAVPSVLCRAFLAMCLAELGAFAEAQAYGAKALRLAEAVEHPYSLALACVAVGHVSLRHGELPQAIHVLERGLALSEAMHLGPTIQMCKARLGAVYALAGRVPEALVLLEQVLEQTRAMWRTSSYPHYAVWLGEGYALAGRVVAARQLGQQALEVARAQQQQGWQAYALRLLGDLAQGGEPPEVALAATFYRQALTMAETLDMRPLQAHCHLGLGTLYATTGRREPAGAALTAAIALYRAMDMIFWLPPAEAALTQVR